MNKILENLEAIRLQKGLKQEFVAQKVGISQQAYSRYFSEQDDMKVSRLQEICSALGVSLVDVVTWPDHYVPESEAAPQCEECRKKDEIIENLNELLTVYKQKLKAKK